MARESFIVYKSFYGLIKLLKAQQRLEMYEAIFEYGFTGAEPDFKDDTSSAIWQAILPQLKANQRRYENGLKGGAPVGNSNARKNNQDSEEKTTEKQPKGAEENNLTLTEKTTEKQPNENVNENDNVNVFKVSKKESKEINLKNTHTAHAREEEQKETYDTIVDDYGVTGEYREGIFRWIAHLQATGLKFVLYERLKLIIVRLDLKYRDDDLAKVNEIDNSIAKGYKYLPCEDV